MKPKFAIVSDGSCDLPAEEAARHDIEVVHFLVSFDGERYAREGVDISLSEFYQQMHDHPRQYPKTAAPSPEGNLLNIKPLITLEDGEIHSSGIRRGRKKSLDGLTDLLCNYLESLQLTPKDCSMILGYSYDEEEALQFADRTALALEEKYGSPVAIPSCRIGATIGVHAGPTAIGFGIIQRADKSLQKKI